MAKLGMQKISLDQELSLREKFFFAIVLVGIFILFLNVLWEPQATRLQVERASYVSLKGQVDALQQLIDATKGLYAKQAGDKKGAAAVSAAVKRILEHRVVDPTTETHDVVNYLSGRGIARNVTVQDVKVGSPVEKLTYTMVPITLTVSGRFGAIMGFFASIERLDKPVIVRRFSMDRSAKGQGIDVGVELEQYLVKR
jgi:Tfp pilus assembly protein PilO